MKRVIIFCLISGIFFSTGFLSARIVSLPLAQDEITESPIAAVDETETPPPTETTGIDLVPHKPTHGPRPTHEAPPTEEATRTAEPTSTQDCCPVTATTTTPVNPATRTPTPISYSRPLVIMTGYNYDVAAYAGGYFTLDVSFENQGQKTAYNVIVTFASNDLIPMGNGGVHSISDLVEDDSESVSQYFEAKSSISSSPSTVTVTINYTDKSNQSYSQSFTIAVDVSYGWATATPTGTPIGRPQLVISSYNTDVEKLYPGTSFTLNLVIQNRGNFEARAANIAIGEQATSSSSSTAATASTNFLPVGSSNVQVLGDLGVSQVVQIQQSFIVNSSATTGAVPVTLSFDYKDPYGISYTEQQIITLLVFSVPSIQVSFYEDPGDFTMDQQGSLPIQVVNLSSSSILLGDISISMQNSTLTNNLVFIGNLDSGGIFTMDSEVIPHQGGTLPVKINVAYQDVFLNDQTISTELSIRVNESTANASPAMQLTAAAEQGASQGWPTGQPAQESFWQVLLRFLRGLIGLDSSASQRSRGPMPSIQQSQTP